MTDAGDLARRFLGLWEDYLTALASEPSTVELLQPWVKAASALLRDPPPREPGGPERGQAPGPPAGAAAATGASDGGDDVVAELAHRVADLEARIAAIERARTAAPRARRRNRGSRPR